MLLSSLPADSEREIQLISLDSKEFPSMQNRSGLETRRLASVCHFRMTMMMHDTQAIIESIIIVNVKSEAYEWASVVDRLAHTRQSISSVGTRGGDWVTWGRFVFGRLNEVNLSDMCYGSDVVPWIHRLDPKIAWTLLGGIPPSNFWHGCIVCRQEAAVFVKRKRLYCNVIEDQKAT